MNHPNPKSFVSISFPNKTFFWLTGILFSGIASAAEFDIAQQPLVVDRQVEPNVVYLHDDSLSMGDSHMPEERTNGTLRRSPFYNRQYYNPDITYQPPYKYEHGRLVSMGSGLVSIEQANSRFTVKNNAWSSSSTFTFSNLGGTGEGTESGYATAIYYDYVPGYNSMRDNPEFDPTKPVETDPHNYEYWAFRDEEAGAWFLKSGNNRSRPIVWGNRPSNENRDVVGRRACPNLFDNTADSTAYHEPLGNTMTFNSSNKFLSKFNGTKKGIPHAQCLYSYRIWDVDIPGTHEWYGAYGNWYADWEGVNSHDRDPRKMGLPVGRPWCDRTDRFTTNLPTTIPSGSTGISASWPLWQPIGNATGTANGWIGWVTCYGGRHRIGDTNGDGKFDAKDDLDAPVSHFAYQGEDFSSTCNQANGACSGLNGPEQSRERLIGKFVTPDGEILLEDTPRRRTGREEIENFANWFAYYRTRAMASQSGASLAFAQLVDKNDTTQPGKTMHGRHVRLGYDTIGKMSLTAGLGRGGTGASGSGVLPFQDFPHDALIPDSNIPHPYAGKTFVKDFYDWLGKLTYPGVTPLRMALGYAGRYYMTDQPWTEYPPLPRSGVNAQGTNISNDGKPYACRRAFTILMTDGYDNVGGPNPTVGRASCREQPEIEYRDADGRLARTTKNNPKYAFFNQTQYNAGIPQGPFCGENLSRFGGRGDYYDSNTLADTAAYYWQTDLQPDIPNRVAGTKKDNAFWQHMQTFTIGLGVQGRISDKEVNEFLKEPERVKDKNIFWAYPTNVDVNPEKIDDLLHAGLNGRGGAAAAQDPGEFVAKLSQLLGEIAGDMSYGSGYLTPPGELTQASVRTFYNTDGPWTGDVQGYEMEWCTQKKQKDGLCKEVGALIQKEFWSAADKLRTRIETRGIGDRKIFTWDGKQGVPFDTRLSSDVKSAIDVGLDRGDPSGALDPCPFPRGDVTKPCALVQKNGGTEIYSVDLLLDYLRGDARYEDTGIAFTGVTYNGFRDRGGAHGKHYLLDIIHSTPYQLGIAGQGKSYVGHFDFGWAGWACGRDGAVASMDCGAARSFLSVTQIRAYHARLHEKIEKFHDAEERGVAYVGGNDGMLHAFRVNDGEELFAFIPQAAHGKLKRLSDPTYNNKHVYTVDGTSFASDIWLDGQWRSVVVGSTGRGGKSFFALDVEEPEKFSEDNILWEFAHDDLGIPANGEPVIQPVAGMDGHWAVTFGNGYNSHNHRAALFVVGLTKAETPTFHVLDTGEGDAQHPNGLGTPLLFNLSGNGLAEVAYAGDALGNLWKFDLVNMKVGNNGYPLLKATAPDGTPQPITAPPGFSIKANAEKTLHLIIGTGKYFEMKDIIDQQVQTIYGVRDFAPAAIMGTATRNRLLQRAYARSDGKVDEFMDINEGIHDLPSWKLAGDTTGTSPMPAPDVEYDLQRGQMGYLIDLDGKNMADLPTGTSGWRVGVQGTEYVSGNYMVPTRIPLDDPCLDKDAGGIVEIEPVHGKWVKSRYWKAVKENANIWRDDRTMGMEIGRDDKKTGSIEVPRLLDFSQGNAGGYSAYAYQPLKSDNARFGILGEKPPTTGDCVTVHIIGAEASGVPLCPGRSGRQSWRQVR